MRLPLDASHLKGDFHCGISLLSAQTGYVIIDDMIEFTNTFPVPNCLSLVERSMSVWLDRKC